jgi:threonine dehydratase
VGWSGGGVAVYIKQLLPNVKVIGSSRRLRLSVAALQAGQP